MSSAPEALLWIPRILALILLAYFLTVQINMVQDIREEPRHLELALYRQRLLTGPHGVVQRDSANRVIPGYLDLDKLTTDYLHKSYVQEVPVFAARLRLYERVEDVGSEKTRIEPTEHYPTLLRQSLALAQANVRGKGSASYERRVYPFLIEEKDGSLPVWLEVEVIRLT